MKKLLASFSVFSILLSLFVPMAYAAESELVPQQERFDPASTMIYEPDIDIIPPVVGSKGSWSGQDHTYSVVFRGNGEAVVDLRVAFTNTDTATMREMSLRLPDGISADNISAYQIIRETKCLRYVYTPATVGSDSLSDHLNCLDYTNITSCDAAQVRGEGCSWYSCANSCLTTGTPTKDICDNEGGNPTVSRVRVCAEHEDPDYYSNYYYGATTKYQRIDVTQDGQTLKLRFPKAVSQDNSGAFFLNYRAFGYTDETLLGAYQYNFETLKVNDSIRNLVVGIRTDADQRLKGANSEINYREESVTFGAIEPAADYAALSSNSALDSYISNVGQGSIRKTASGLAPLESYTTEGKYADGFFKLYAREFTITILVILFVALGAFFVVRFIYKRISKDDPPKPSKTTKERQESMKMFLYSSGVSFLSSFATVAYLAGVIYFSGILTSIVGYQFSTILTLLIIVISIGVVVCVLLVPGVVVAYKKSIGWGITTVVMTICWLVIMFFVLAIVLSLVFSTNYPRPPIYF